MSAFSFGPRLDNPNCLLARGLRSGSAARTDSSLRAADFPSGRSTHPHRMVQSDPTDAHGNLFPIFLLSLIQFFLVPITLWRVGSWAIDAAYGDKEKKGAAASAVAAPTDVSSEWGKAAAARAARNRPTAARRLRALFSGANLWLLAFWAVSAALAAYIAFSQVEEAEHFDPYKVLNVPVGADASVIKKAYRALSLQYPPARNPAPGATGTFTDQIPPAHKPLPTAPRRITSGRYGPPAGNRPRHLAVARSAAAARLPWARSGAGIRVLPSRRASCRLSKCSASTRVEEWSATATRAEERSRLRTSQTETSLLDVLLRHRSSRSSRPSGWPSRS